MTFDWRKKLEEDAEKRIRNYIKDNLVSDSLDEEIVDSAYAEGDSTNKERLLRAIEVIEKIHDLDSRWATKGMSNGSKYICDDFLQQLNEELKL